MAPEHRLGEDGDLMATGTRNAAAYADEAAVSGQQDQLQQQQLLLLQRQRLLQQRRRLAALAAANANADASAGLATGSHAQQVTSSRPGATAASGAGAAAGSYAQFAQQNVDDDGLASASLDAASATGQSASGVGADEQQLLQEQQKQKLQQLRLLRLRRLQRQRLQQQKQLLLGQRRSDEASGLSAGLALDGVAGGSELAAAGGGGGHRRRKCPGININPIFMLVSTFAIFIAAYTISGAVTKAGKKSQKKSLSSSGFGLLDDLTRIVAIGTSFLSSAQHLLLLQRVRVAERSFTSRLFNTQHTSRSNSTAARSIKAYI
jgi:hypothetical protein